MLLEGFELPSVIIEDSFMDGLINPPVVKYGSKEDILGALEYLKPDEYSLWLETGMALKTKGEEYLPIWDEWSKQSTKYKSNEVQKKWDSFKGEGITIATLFQRAKEAGYKSPSKKEGIAAINAAEWIPLEPEPLDPVVDGLFDTGDKIAIIGKSKRRKSFFSLQLALSLAAGLSHFIDLRIPKPRRVLVVQYEIKAKNYHRRLRNMSDGLGIGPEYLEDRLHVINARGMSGIEDQVEKIALDLSCDVILFDPLYKMLDGDENAAHDMKPLLRRFDQLAEHTNAAIIYVHHDKKGDVSDYDPTDRGAGTGVLGRDYDCCIALSSHNKGDHLTIIDSVLRNYPSVDPFVIEWDGFSHIRSTEAPVLPSKTKQRNPQPVDKQMEQVLEILQEEGEVMPLSQLRQDVKKNIGLTERDQKALIDRMLNKKVLKTIGQGTKEFSCKMIGTPEAIKAALEQIENNNEEEEQE